MSNDSDIAAMTVNERLSHLGLFDEFDSALAARDLNSVISVLLRAELSPGQAVETATAVLADPGKYGYP